jgi:hypothetical protein
MKLNVTPKWLFLGLLIVFLAAAGCSGLPLSQDNQQSGPAAGLQNAFSLSQKGEEGTQVGLVGYTVGYQLGESYTLGFTLNNSSSAPWTGSYCLQLLSQEGIEATLAQDDFNLQAGQGFSRDLDLQIPENIEPGPYGLALVIPERSTSVTTIWVGQETDTQVGAWPQAQCP